MSDNIELEKKIAILSACVMVLAMESESRTRLIAARISRILPWIVAARLSEPSEDWRTPKWGGAYEEEV